ncbi:hypothetical protein [Domibacillus indicus]|uniref:hypothetical protein n=1 Tax=Domibacillus indicus TaxID=1437523 RepID=UPI000617F771|nr:hypothetical protein [Domibacillus indicus]
MKPPYPRNTQQESSSSTSETTLAKLAFIASAITTLGDAIATFAAALALEELSNSNSNTNSNSRKQVNSELINKKLIDMQNQIDYLTREISKRQ